MVIGVLLLVYNGRCLFSPANKFLQMFKVECSRRNLPQIGAWLVLYILALHSLEIGNKIKKKKKT